MTGNEQRQLHRQLWKVADELRGRMDADDFRDYILGFVFFKYLSERVESHADKLLQPEHIGPYDALDPTTHHDYLQAIREDCTDALGYVLAPEQLFRGLVQQGRQGGFVLEKIKSALTAIEASAANHASADDFIHLFEDMDLDNSRLGRTPDARNDLIVRVIQHLDAIDFQLDQGNHDVLGDAYEYLIGQFASGAGKKAGEFYTPGQVSRLLARLVTHGRTRIREAYDPTCGSGSLLLRIGREADVHMYRGQELNRTTYNLARMNMLLHDIHYSKFDIRQGDTLTDPAHLDHRFDVIVANPPFSAKWKGPNNPLNATDDRFARYGRVAPASKADFAFVQHILHHLADNGTAAVVLPHGVLFRGAAEGVIRKYIIQDLNALDAVIGLPPKLFYGTSIATCVLVLKQCREQDDDILFIDASRDFMKDGKNNTLTDAHITRIVETWTARQDVDRYARVVPMAEIAGNGFNLNIPRYVDMFEPEPPIDLDEVVAEMRRQNQRMAELSRVFQSACAELGVEFPDFCSSSDLLKKFKRGLMQKLFSQELRFNDDQGHPFPDWQVKRLGEVATFLKGKGISKVDVSEDGTTPCIRYGELYTEYSEYITRISSCTNAPLHKSILSKKNDLLMPTSDVTPGGLATASALDIEGAVIGGDILVIRSSDILNRYLAYFISANKAQIMRLVTGTTVCHIYSSDLATIKIPLPTLPEQQKIADLLSTLDRRIDGGGGTTGAPENLQTRPDAKTIQPGTPL